MANTCSIDAFYNKKLKMYNEMYDRGDSRSCACSGGAITRFQYAEKTDLFTKPLVTIAVRIDLLSVF